MKTLLKTIYLFLLVNPFLTTTAQITFNPSNNSTPAAAANNITLNANIVLNFSAAVKTSTATAGNIRIRGKNTGIIEGIYSGGTTTQVTFNPTNNFFAGEVITVTLTSGLQNTTNTALSNPTSFSFTTKSSLSSFTPSWLTPDIASTVTSSRGIFIADINKDRYMDIVTHFSTNNSISWHENDGNTIPSFTDPQEVYSSNSGNITGGLSTADLDNDGDMDVVAADFTNNKLIWFENDGNETPSWTERTIAVDKDGARSVSYADLDNDGDLDIVLGVQRDNQIRWYENNGDATSWTENNITDDANSVRSVVAVDINLDGHIDIISAEYGDNEIVYYENNGSTNPTFSSTVISSVAYGANNVLAADLDNNGNVKIVSSQYGDGGDNVAKLVLHTYSNLNAAYVTRLISEESVNSIVLADINNNGTQDIITGSFTGNEILSFEYDEFSSSFSRVAISTSAGIANYVFVADLDNDGDLDIVSSSINGVSWYENSNANTWDGSVDNVWATADNWSNGVPVTNSDVTIPASLANYPTAANAVAVRSVTLASGTSLIASNTFSGAITYNRNLATNNWYTVSSPVVNETYDNAYVTANGIASGANNNKAIATYVTNGDSWDYMQAGETATFASGTGYSVKRTNAGDISFTGTMKVNNTTIALTTAGNGYNLIGNPYPSYINSADILTNNTDVLAAQTIWVWNQATSTYVAKVTGQAFKIAPGQGFIVKSDGSAGNVVINESYQSHQTTDTFLRTEVRPGISLTLTDNSISRQTQIYYIDGTTAGYDNGYDGQMFGGVANEFAIYTHLVSKSDGDDYAIQSLPNNNYENMIVPVGINAVSGKTITITAAAENLPEEINIYLEDKDNDSFTLLDAAANYSTTLENNLSGIGRFYLHTSTAALSANDFATNNNISIYSSSKENLRIAGIQNGKKAKLQLYNVLGKEILRTSFEGNGVNNVSLPTLNTGVYIVKIATENRTLNKKIHIK